MDDPGAVPITLLAYVSFVEQQWRYRWRTRERKTDLMVISTPAWLAAITNLPIVLSASVRGRIYCFELARWPDCCYERIQSDSYRSQYRLLPSALMMLIRKPLMRIGVTITLILLHAVIRKCRSECCD